MAEAPKQPTPPAAPATGKRPPRIPTETAVLMVCVAVILDLISLIPVVGSTVSSILYLCIFGLWFIMRSVPLLGAKKVASWGLNFVAEIFPGVGSVWPGVTVGVILMIVITRTEDKTGISVMDKVGGGGIGPKDLRRLQNPQQAGEALLRKVRMDQMRTDREIAQKERVAQMPKERPQMRDVQIPEAA